LVPEVRRGMPKTVISDFQRRGNGWTSKHDIRGMSVVISLKGNKICVDSMVDLW